MKVVIGYGNELRGEDAFGIDVIKELKKFKPKETKLLSSHQLTPELVLDLLEADEVIFVDVCYEEKNCYELACSTTRQKNLNISHQIYPSTIMQMLKSLYEKTPAFSIYSMQSNSFEKILDIKKYKENLKKVTKYIFATHLDKQPNQIYLLGSEK